MASRSQSYYPAAATNPQSTTLHPHSQSFAAPANARSGGVSPSGGVGGGVGGVGVSGGGGEKGGIIGVTKQTIANALTLLGTQPLNKPVCRRVV